MSEFEKLRIVTGYEFLKHIRRKRLWIIFGLALLAEAAVLILIPVLSDGYPGNVMVMAAVLTIGPALAVIAAVLISGVTFGLGHDRTLENFLVTGLLYGVPFAAVFSSRDWEHAVGAHYMVNMIPMVIVFLET